MLETIPGLLLRAADRDPDGIWLRSDDGQLTFAGAAGEVARVAERLAGAGVKRGDLVVLTARGTPPYLLCWLALTSMGAVAIATNPKSTAAELEGLIGQVRPRLVVTDAEIDDLTEGWEQGRSGSVVYDVVPDDLATLIPTSGTTGRSKLVMQSHRAYAWAGEGFPYWMELDSSDRMMTTLPLFHVNAPAYSVMGSLACGAGLVLMPSFSATGFLDAARRHGATEFNAIGAMLEILMRQPERPNDAETDLRLCYAGPSPTRDWQEAFEERFGLRVVCGYAMSETPYGLVWQRGTRPFGTLGTPRQHPRLGLVNEARVVDANGHDVPVSRTGELMLRNPVVMQGYWEMPEQTAETIVDGWLRTGDLVTPNADGTFTFVSRLKEVLRRRGENLSPAEVEEAIAAHPDVLEAAVVGVPSELSEEDIKAYVVAEAGRELDFAELREWTGQRISAFKVPRFWQALDALPRTPTARVAKHRLPEPHGDQEWDSES